MPTRRTRSGTGAGLNENRYCAINIKYACANDTLNGNESNVCFIFSDARTQDDYADAAWPRATTGRH